MVYPQKNLNTYKQYIQIEAHCMHCLQPHAYLKHINKLRCNVYFITADIYDYN